MRRVQEILSTDGMLHSIDHDQPSAAPAVALKEKRLTFTWLDGEAQQVSAFFSMSDMPVSLRFSYALQFTFRVEWILSCDGFRFAVWYLVIIYSVIILCVQRM